jgi:hypothetical protein
VKYLQLKVAKEVTEVIRSAGDRSDVVPKNVLDKLGAGMSFACALHCLVLPVVAGVLPFTPVAATVHEGFHEIFLTLCALIAFWSLTLGYRVHRKASLFLLLLMSLGLFYIAHAFSGEVSEAVLMGCGGAGVALCHLANSRFCKLCRRCCEHS